MTRRVTTGPLLGKAGRHEYYLHDHCLGLLFWIYGPLKRDMSNTLAGRYLLR